MQRTSESIATLAAALAKAQTELVNPEKSLTATIRPEGPGREEQTFRYASLASGLEVVRKVLGKHDIAALQTTSVDQTSGTINLTTVLAHSSGEWIASDWPVCSVREIETPHRMGAALTYARRYSLFTLVGIAGEDDLDAPDLVISNNRTPNSSPTAGSYGSASNGSKQTSSAQGPKRSHGKPVAPDPKPILGTADSAKLRDRLIAEIDQVPSADDAALWARRSLAKKNQLTPADAELTEKAFKVRLQTLHNNEIVKPENASRPRVQQSKRDDTPNGGIDKTVLALSEPRRVRDREHIRFVAQHACVVCGRQPADAHHLRFAQSRALGKKVSDEFTVPLCRGHHREVHRCGDEATWWSKIGIDPLVVAEGLWKQSRPLTFAGASGPIALAGP